MKRLHFEEEILHPTAPAASPTLPRVTKLLLMCSNDLVSSLPSAGQREEGRSGLESTGQSRAQGMDPA